jgi:polyphosphate kinase
VRSIVDRFLEHSRIFYFENAGQPEVFLSSADWMPRNFFRRIETGLPILDGNLRERVVSELLALPLADNTRARLLQPTGRYQVPARPRSTAARRSQFEFIALASEGGRPTKAPRSAKRGYPKVQLAKRPF